MLISSLVDCIYLYEDHSHTLFNNSDKVSSETSLGYSTIEQKAIDSGWSLFCCRGTDSNTNFSIYKNARRTKPAFYRRETNS